jgi:hypothetical protein
MHNKFREGESTAILSLEWECEEHYLHAPYTPFMVRWLQW